jgi:hypothetical protein
MRVVSVITTQVGSVIALLMSANVIRSTIWLGKLKKAITAALLVENIKILLHTIMVTIQAMKVMTILTMTRLCSRSKYYLLQL